MTLVPLPAEAAAKFSAAGGKVAVAVAGVAIADLDDLLPGVAFEAADLDVMGPHPWTVTAPSAVIVVARTPTDLRRVVTLGEALPAVTMVGVVVLEAPPWCDAPGVPLSPGLGRRVLREVSVAGYAKSGWRVRARFAEPRPAGEVTAAVARSFGGHHLNAYALPVAGLAGPGLADWRPGDPDARFSGTGGPVPDRADVPAADLAVRATGLPGEGLAGPPTEGPDEPPTEGPDEPLAGGSGGLPTENPSVGGDGEPAGRPAAVWADDRIPVVDRPADLGWARFGSPGGYDALRATVFEPDAVPPVDERTVNPRGFLKTPKRGFGTLVQGLAGWEARLEGRTVVRLPASGGVTDADVGRLRRLRGLGVSWRPAHTGPVAAVRAVASLAAAGVPLVSRPVPGWAARALGPELTALLTAAGEADLADELRREEHSVRLRRAALNVHGTTARWRSLAARTGVPVPPRPSISVIMCTRRAGLVPFALAQIARQRGVELEVVLTLHGVPADAPEVARAVAAFPRPITIVEADAALPFGVVLNQAAARASGSFLSKWDDDDWYGPDHLADMALAHAYSGAELVGAASEFFYLQQIDVTIRRNWTSETMSDHVAGGTFVVSRSAFEALGGFRPVARAVDVQFFQHLLRAGGAIYRAHGLGFVARRAARGRHTWQEPVGYFLARAREQWRGFRPSLLMECEPGPPDGREPGGPMELRQ
ncbi:glycosyltransferase [Sphaerisporangium sp. TRM90804]|uniref:glycosyltransferase n=1 Tax=Sphaerisporangium sp. TRM90804 TaxID=3031113 RepID=UPI00244C8194|nr:glycosyltransferase [Sphaerisporangium sp. TRM90804]MDH2426641.1 glycosyl transferase family 2 [Sphaerisporangium sp. TRM90804]